MRKLKTALACLGILLITQSFGQNIPLGTLPMLFNGGFAGEGEHARVITGIGTRHGISFLPREKMVNYFGSYDQFLPKLRTGIGITFNRAHYNYYNFSDSKYYAFKQNSLIISLSPKFSFNGKYTFAPFVDVVYSTREDSRVNSLIMHHTIRTGFLFNSRKFYIGLTYNPSTKPYSITPYFSDQHERYPLILQTGYTFQRLPESNFSFTPQIAFFIRTNSSDYERTLDLDLNLMFRYKKLIGTINNNGLGVGMQTKQFRVLLSQNYILNLNSRWQGSLSFRYVFK